MNTARFTNANASTLAVCTPVYSSAAGSIDKAKADTAATAVVIGLVADPAGIAHLAKGTVVTDGILRATTGQWDTITGGSGGLTFGTIYYLDASTAGKLTTAKPSIPVVVGRAASTTELVVEISAGPIANVSTTSASSAIANTETQVAVMTIPANTLAVGSTFKVKAIGTTNGAVGGTCIARVRLGPTTLTGAIVATVSKAEISNSSARLWEAVVTVRTTGASGGAVGALEWHGGDGGGYDLMTRNYITSPVTIDTTVANLLEFTYISGNSGISCTFSQVVIEWVA